MSNIFGVKNTKRTTYEPILSLSYLSHFHTIPTFKVPNHVGVGPSQGTAQKNTLLRRHPSHEQNKKVSLQNSSLKITRTACKKEQGVTLVESEA
jgi:hypothetical protein